MNFKNKPILGMIHLSGSDSKTKINRAFEEIGILMDGGVDGIIVENYHGSVDDVVKVLEFIQGLNFPKRGMDVGINILPNDFGTALKLAEEYGANFIQLDYVAGRYVNTPVFDESTYVGLSALSTKSPIVLGGVWPKYYIPIEGSILKNDIEDALFFCDAVVVTGSGTGKETPLDKIKLFREYIQSNRKFGRTPLIIGAGLDASNVAEQLPFADGAIVGSCFKPYKRTQEMISKVLVKEFIDEVKKIRNEHCN